MKCFQAKRMSLRRLASDAHPWVRSSVDVLCECDDAACVQEDSPQRREVGSTSG